MCLNCSLSWKTQIMNFYTCNHESLLRLTFQNPVNKWFMVSVYPWSYESTQEIAKHRGSVRVAQSDIRIRGCLATCQVIPQLDENELTINQLFYSIGIILPNVSFLKPTESLETLQL